MPRRIVLEETGECRFPRANELYLYDGEVFNAEDYDDSAWLDTPESYTILRVAQSDWIQELERNPD